MFTDPPGTLLPFGAHKGYALGLVAELLAGVLSDGGTIQPQNPRHGVQYPGGYEARNRADNGEFIEFDDSI